jgi:adenylate cyclase
VKPGLELRRRYREIVLLAAIAGGAALSLVAGGRVELVDGVLYDAGLALAPSRSAAAQSPVAVVAVDQQSLATGALASTPRVFFGPHYATLLDGLFAAGARAVGVDIIFAYASSRFAAVDPAYDDPLLTTLARHRDKVVVARTAGTPVADPFVAALFDPERDAGREEPLAIAYSELVPSEDGVQRWIHARYATADGATLPTLAARLAAIAGAKPDTEAFLLAPRAPLESAPTYALGDVLGCLATDPAAVKATFGGKVVVIGSNLPEEDRKRGPDRFLAWPTSRAGPSNAGSCKLVALGPSVPASDSVPGVHIHAAGVASLLTGTGVRLAVPSVRIATVGIAALASAAFGLFLAPGIAVAAFIGLLAALFALSVSGIIMGQWLPVAVPMLAALLALLGGQLTRYLVEDRRRKRLERQFGRYLAPTIVSQLAESDGETKLGGEERDITILFADLTNFTGVSDTMEPAALMQLTNRYFRVIVDVIDANGGYVDKFIGDAVMAMWGAPVRTRDAAASALKSALDMRERIRQFNARGGGGTAVFDVKIAVTSGPAVVGNVGTPQRLSYTALGATVNLAARLEKMCGVFGSPIVVDAATHAALHDRYLFCELDAVNLKGKRWPVSVYGAIVPTLEASPQQRDYVARYAQALRCHRAGELDRAAALWAGLDATTVPGCPTLAAGVMARRALSGEQLATAPAVNG